MKDGKLMREAKDIRKNLRPEKLQRIIFFLAEDIRNLQILTFNRSWNIKKIPENWKIANVVPVF